jgi:hypothetical protein
MDLPVVRTWVKQQNLVASNRIDAFNVVGLMQVAARAGPREIVKLRVPTTRAWYYMLDMESGSLE